MRIEEIAAEAAREICGKFGMTYPAVGFLGAEHWDDVTTIIKAAIEKAMEASKQVCEIYFNIAADAVGEEAVRIRRDAMIEVWEKSRGIAITNHDH